MGKRTLCAALCLAYIFSAGSQTTAAELPSTTIQAAPQTQTQVVPQGPQLIVNGKTLTQSDMELAYDTTYVNYLPVLKALYPDATAVWQNGVRIQAQGLDVMMHPGLSYIVANGRYLPLEDLEVYVGGQGAVMAPLRMFCGILGADVHVEGMTITVTPNGKGPIQSAASFYNADDLYWLSHIINAESGNQPLKGKIAVGNVVLNRVSDARFPNTVKGVIFQRSQFTPVSNGSIYLDPNAESVMAAKLCLEGANTAGNSLYFLNPRSSPNSWASRNRPHVATIGAHAFYA